MSFRWLAGRRRAEAGGGGLPRSLQRGAVEPESRGAAEWKKRSEEMSVKGIVGCV